MTMKIKLFLLLILLSTVSLAQTDSVKSSWYGRVMPISLYTGAGSYDDRMSQYLEVGKSIGVIDIGLAYGRMNQHIDNENYLEAKVTMDACQIGIFSNEFTIGGGHVFNTQTPIMLELSTTIFAQIGDHWGMGVVTGYYDFSGQYSDVNKNYYGIFLRMGLLRSQGGILMNRRMYIHH